MTRISKGSYPLQFTGTASPELHLVIFKLDQCEYGVEVNDVLGIYQGAAIIPTPDEPECYVGEVYLFGHRIPVVSLRRALNLDLHSDKAGWLILLHHAGQPIAILVDQVAEVIRVKPPSLVPVSEESKHIPAYDYLTVSARYQNRMIYLPDLPRLLAESLA